MSGYYIINMRNVVNAKDLVVREINLRFNKSRIIYADIPFENGNPDYTKIQISYSLQIPSVMDVFKFLNKSGRSVWFSKKGEPTRRLFYKDGEEANRDKVPAHWFNIKKRRLKEEVTYNFTDIFEKDNLIEFIWSEWNKAFKEDRANIALEKIGEYTKEWESIIDGKFFSNRFKSGNETGHHKVTPANTPFIWNNGTSTTLNYPPAPGIITWNGTTATITGNPVDMSMDTKAEELTLPF